MGICCSFIQDAWDSARDFVGDVIDFTGDILEEAWDEVVEFGKDALEEVFSWIGIEGQTVYLVSAQSYPILEDQVKENGPVSKMIFRHATINSNLRNEWLMYNLNGIKITTDKFLDYASTTYFYGLPTVRFLTSDQDEAAANAVLAGIEGGAITIEKIQDYEPISIGDYVRSWLDTNTTYDYETSYIVESGIVYRYIGYINNVTSYTPVIVQKYSHFDVYSLKFERVTAGGTETTTITEVKQSYYNSNPTGPEVQTAAPYDVVKPDQGNPDETWYEIIAVKNITQPGLNKGPITAMKDQTLGYVYMLVEYHLTSQDDTKTKIWVYDRTSGVYPTLNYDPVTGNEATSIFPVMPLRIDFININSDPQHARYTTSVKLMDFLGLKPDNFITEIEKNPDKDKIRDVFLQFGANVYSEHQGVLRAVGDWIESMWQNSAVTETEFNSSTYRRNPTGNMYKVVEQSSDQVMKWNYVKKENIAGTIGNLDHYQYSLNILPNSPSYGGYYVSWDGDGDSEYIPSYGNIPLSEYILEWQHSPTHYTRYTVSGLVKVQTVIAGDGSYHAVVIKLQDPNDVSEEADQQRSLMNIPFSRNMIAADKPDHLEQAMYGSIRLLIYANDSYYLKYYQTSKFSVFATFVSWVITIFSLGSSTAVTETLLEVAKRFLYQYVITLVLVEVLEQFDSPFAKALAFVVYAVASYKIQFGNEFSFDKFITSAEELMFATNAVTTFAELDQSLQLESLQEEIDEFENLARDRDEMLQAALDGLDTGGTINVYDILTVIRNRPYEKPDMFYMRTVHDTNPGVKSLDQIENFVDAALQLPELE